MAIGAIVLVAWAPATGADDVGERGPAPPPTVSADPASDLVDGQVVEVTVTGFDPDDVILLAMCPPGWTSIGLDCSNEEGERSPDGTLSTSYQVDAIVHQYLPAGEVDCRTETCELVALSIDDYDRFATTPLSFDPDGPLDEPRIMRLTPEGEYVDGQEIGVAITGFEPDGAIDLLQCSFFTEPDGTGCDEGAVQHLTADGSGAAATTYTLHGSFESERGPIQCVGGKCVLVAVDRSVPDPVAEQAYTFELLYIVRAAPAGPSPAEPPPAVANVAQPTFTG